MGKTYLVTGAAGFIGSALATRLIELGNKVFTIDNLSTGYIENIPNGVKFIEGNCFDKAIIAQLENCGIDIIYHIAGQSSGEISFENPEYDINTNTLSTLLLLDFAKRHHIEKFIYASTMSVYGDQNALPVTETASTQPKSFYAVGKLASEQYLKIYHDLGVNSLSLRLFNVYGPGQNLQNMKQGMASIFMAQAIKENIIEVRGSLERFRDFVYIDDVVSAFLNAENYNYKEFKNLNICSGKAVSVEQLINLISRQFENKIEVVVKDGTLGDQFGIYGTNTEAQDALAWTPKTDINEGIKKMFDWAIKTIK